MKTGISGAKFPPAPGIGGAMGRGMYQGPGAGTLEDEYALWEQTSRRDKATAGEAQGNRDRVKIVWFFFSSTSLLISFQSSTV